MAKTTWKVISYYEGTQTVQEILVDLIAEKGSFEPFYEETVLLQETDPNVIYDMKNTLDGFRVYQTSEIEGFADIFYSDDTQTDPFGTGICQEQIQGRIGCESPEIRFGRYYS